MNDSHLKVISILLSWSLSLAVQECVCVCVCFFSRKGDESKIGAVRLFFFFYFLERGPIELLFYTSPTWTL